MSKNTDSSMKTRSKTVTHEISGVVYREEATFISKSKLQSEAHFIGRMIHLYSMRLCHKVFLYNDARKIVAQELSDNWISKNVYPLCQQNTAKKLRGDTRLFLHRQFLGNGITLIRQLGEMEFFFPIIDPDINKVRKDSDRESQSTDSKITRATLTPTQMRVGVGKTG